MIRRGWLILLGIALVLSQTLSSTRPAEAAGCQFELGFKAFVEETGGLVGRCVENEHHNPVNGDSLQQTTKGLLVWRKSDNWTAFTDGTHTWVHGPKGIAERANASRFPWEGASSTLAPLGATASAPVPIRATPNQPDWLSHLNFLRSLAGLPRVVEDPSLNQGAADHARYMVENGIVAHSEDPSRPGYTPDGNDAAASSELIAFSWINSDANALDGLVEGPFHALGLLDPSMTSAGFASFQDSRAALQTGAVVHLGASWGTARPSDSAPITFPANGAQVPLYTIATGEHPDPLASCPGYSQPAGVSVIFEYGEGGSATNVGAHRLLRDGVPIAHCVYDASTYTNPDPSSQALGRALLAGYHAVVLVPQQPLVPGSTYSVHLVVNAQSYSWSFHAAPR